MKLVRALLVSAISTALVISFSTASAAGIAGSKCTKANATKTVGNIKYSCTKTGKKLTWKKVENTKSATTTSENSTAIPAPSPSASKSPAAPTIDQLVLKYLDTVTSELAVKYKSLTDETTIQIADIVDSEAEKLLVGQITVESIIPAKKFTSLFLPPTTDEIMVAIGSNDVYVAGTVGDACEGINDQTGKSCGQGFLYANTEALIDKYKIANDNVLKSDPSLQFEIWTNIPHLMFHQVQSITSVDSSGLDRYELYPSWLREGGAEVAKIMTYAIFKNISYQDARSIYQKRVKGSCKNLSLNASAEPYVNSCEFVLGLYGSEYLIYKTKDFNSLFEVSKNVADDVESTFLESYKFSLVDFIKESEPYLRTQNQ